MTTGHISKIQRYTTKDGPGLRSTVFLMGCNLKCKWCANPETITCDNKVMYFKERCHHCGLCVQAADNDAISLTNNGCLIDREKCTNLQDMVAICPYDAYELIGKKITSEQLADTLSRDQDFYTTSNGGVTFSGGEAVLQSEFVKEVAQILRKQGIHVCLDTAGNIPWNIFESLLEEIDMVLYDIKAYASKIHYACTGVNNTLILDNARKIADKGVAMVVRMIVVPGQNDDMVDMKNRIDFISSLGSAVQQLDILKYHTLGVGKYHKLGEVYELERTTECNDKVLNEIKQYALSKGIKISIGG